MHHFFPLQFRFILRSNLLVVLLSRSFLDSALGFPYREGMKIGFILKIVVLCAALGFVIYGIRALQSPQVQTKLGEPNSALGILLGSDQRPLNWCPQNVQKVEIFSETGQVFRVLSTPQDISAVCELLIGGFTQSSETPPAFYLKMRAYPVSGNPVSLEATQDGAVFRVQGLPFSSPGLVKVLKRLGPP